MNRRLYGTRHQAARVEFFELRRVIVAIQFELADLDRIRAVCGEAFEIALERPRIRRKLADSKTVDHVRIRTPSRSFWRRAAIKRPCRFRSSHGCVPRNRAPPGGLRVAHAGGG